MKRGMWYVVVGAVVLATAPARGQTPADAKLEAQIEGGSLKSLRYGGWEFLARVGKLPEGATARYRVEENKLLMEITVKNGGSEEIKSLTLRPFAMQFPKKPKGWPWIANGSLTKENVGEPTILTADWGEGAVVACDEEIGRHCRFGWLATGAKDVVTREVGIETFADWPIKPGETRKMAFSFRFGDRPDPATDIRTEFLKAYPPTLEWADRRPIQAVFLATSGKNWETNPRGYFGDAKLDVRTEEGIAELRRRALKLADDTVARLKDVGGQGAIIWDIEGGEMPHAVTYLGDPRVLSQVAPEMDAVADAFFRRFADAGLRTGVCIRPSEIVFKDPTDAKKYPWIKGRYGHSDTADPVAVLADKIAYAKKRWGCSIFYMDTNYTPVRYDGAMVRRAGGSPEFRMLTAWEMKELHRRHPDVLIFPEFQSAGYFASVSGYGEMHRVGEFSADVHALYPKGFRVWMPRLSAEDLYQHWEAFVNKGVKGGEVFLYEGKGTYGEALKHALAEAAEARPAPRELAALLEAVKREGGWAYRRRVIEALGGFKEASVTKTLAAVMKTEKSGLEIFAARALGRQGTAEAMEALVGTLPARAAAYGLGASGKAEAVGPLAKLLTEKVPAETRWAALDALGELKKADGVAAVAGYMKAIAGTPAEMSREKAVAALGAMGDRSAVGVLIEAMGSAEYARLRPRIGDALVAITGFDGGTASAYEVGTWRKWREGK